jgi:N6-L-threonylcarbamoyladenine synthase
VVLGGGVACNGALQQAMRERFAGRGGDVFAPSPRLATDNAAMIAAAGLFRAMRGEWADPSFTAQASLPIPGLVSHSTTHSG